MANETVYDPVTRIPRYPVTSREDGRYLVELRDWYAGQALAAGVRYANPKAVAEYAFALADALLAARGDGRPRIPEIKKAEYQLP